MNDNSRLVMSKVSPESEAHHPPLWHNMVGGLVGNLLSDTVMHSLDTIKTRQQAAPQAIQYQNTLGAYRVIFKQEGLIRGLYAGYEPAVAVAIPRGLVFFGIYETIKRKFIDDYHVNDTVTHLFAGFMGDLITSVLVVPSEVLKARLQLQGSYNNKYFNSGYNYKSTADALSSIIRTEGWSALFSGYKATLFRDLPYSALQFAFYEKFRQLALRLEGKKSKELSVHSELITGAVAGGLTGFVTTPLDVLKTRLQTKAGSHSLSSIFRGLIEMYRAGGIPLLFSGVVPRVVWVSVQSSIMFLVYQEVMKNL